MAAAAIIFSVNIVMLVEPSLLLIQNSVQSETEKIPSKNPSKSEMRPKLLKSALETKDQSRVCSSCVSDESVELLSELEEREQRTKGGFLNARICRRLQLDVTCAA